MTATTTMMPVSPPNERIFPGSPCSRFVKARSKGDIIERFFSWSETVFCSHHPGDIIPFSERDENVPDDTVGNKNDVADDEVPKLNPIMNDLLDNNLCECSPDKMMTDEKDNDDMLEYVFENVHSFTCAPADGNRNPLLLPDRNHNHDHNNEDENSLLEEGHEHGRTGRHNGGDDLLDYCFEHVESLVCTEGKEALVLVPISKVPENTLIRVHHQNRKKRSLTTTTTTGNHRGSKITRSRRTPTTPSTLKYGLYQEGIERAELRIIAPKNMAIVSC